ncbi:MAG: hypothetical protein ACLPZR_23420 [Solirubrobacteraceae bacterium]
MMARSVTDDRLQELRNAVQRIGQNLVDLELDPNRELLETSRLTGVSADRWSTASARLAELWQWNGLLQAHVEHANKLRDAKRFEQLESLLDGQSIELSTTDVPMAQRTLLGDAQVTDRVSLGQLLQRMSAAFDEVKVVVAGIGAAWDKLIPRVGATRQQLTECRQLADAVGESARTDLQDAAKRLAAINATTTSDPLAVKSSEIDALGRSIAAIRSDLASVGQLKSEFDGRMASARELVARLRGLAADGRAAREELLAKIAQPTAPAAVDLPPDVDGGLPRIQALGAGGDWREARRELDAWTIRTGALVADAQRILAANRAPIESRNEYRALLDAYQVKAKALGRIEDPDLAKIYGQAHDALYTAPTDLALVAELVRRYQRILNGIPATGGEPL